MHAYTDAIKDIFDSLEKVKISTLTELWKKLITTFMDDFEGSKTSAEEVSTPCSGNHKRTRSGA